MNKRRKIGWSSWLWGSRSGESATDSVFKVLVAARVSSPRMKGSIPTQLESGVEAATKDGYTSISQHSYLGSAWRCDEHLQKLLTKITNENIRIVFLREPDRLSRKLSHWMDFVTRLPGDLELKFWGEGKSECNTTVSRDKPFGSPYNTNLYRSFLDAQTYASECSRKGVEGARVRREKRQLQEAMEELELASNPPPPPPGFWNVERLESRLMKKRRVHFRVKWVGSDETTLEPRSKLLQDVPQLVREFEKNRRETADNPYDDIEI